MNISINSTTATDQNYTDMVKAFPLSTTRIKKAKASYNVRNVDLKSATQLLNGNLQPEIGDVVLARIKVIGQHQKIELGTGRRAGLHVGDEIIVCYGSRYAPDQFESYIPDSLEPCHLVAGGGIASISVNRHSKMKPPTSIEPLGILADHTGKRINIANWALPSVITKHNRPHTVAVLGTAMNAGKTTTAAGIVRTLAQHGFRVGAAKVTGTGSGGDRWKMVDAGAYKVLDFTDAGVPTTFGVPFQQLETIFDILVSQLISQESDVIVLEVADGVYQQETAELIASDFFLEKVDNIIFAAPDGFGAAVGVNILRKLGHSVLAVSGLINASPLAIREAKTVLDLPILSPEKVGVELISILAENTASDSLNISPIAAASDLNSPGLFKQAPQLEIAHS